MTKMNCWEFKKCGREAGGTKADELGVCVATVSKEFEGINNGKEAGRICWALAGTLCGGSIQGEYAKKMESCIKCDFYHLVSKEESNFELYPKSMARVNCWDYKKCGREVGGSKIEELGVCPASIDSNLTSINSGKNGGRSCWAVAGTLCGGKVQGVFAEKLVNCVTCDFYNKVLNEETDFMMYPGR
ncbi:MAG: two-CW domain-containing protein [Candidatus Hodarchaeota archaeon]